MELGLSYNLQVRERPLYHVLLGAVQHHHDDAEACVQSMRTALSLNKGKSRPQPNSICTNVKARKKPNIFFEVFFYILVQNRTF